MKGNSLLVGLASLLAAISAGVTLLCYQHVQLSRSLNRAQYAIAQVEIAQKRLKALADEAIAFSRRDTSILPILQSVGLHPAQADR